MDLKWGDHDEGCDDLIEDVVNSEDKNVENVGLINGEPNSILSNASIKEHFNEVRRRIHRAPVYLNDYVTSEGFSDEDIKVSVAQVVSADPSSFERLKRVLNGDW